MNTNLPCPHLLVTGGAGYIGSAVAKALLKRGYHVHILDDLSRGCRSALPAQAAFHQMNLHETIRIRALVEKFQITSVLHFAAFAKVAESIRHPELYFQNNTQGTISLLNAVRGTTVKNFIFSSTAAVYGDANIGTVKEDATLDPKNPYGQSKLLAEQQIQQFGQTDPHFNYIIFRYFNVAGCDVEANCGPRDADPSQLIRRACRSLLGLPEKFEIYGTDYPTPDGTCVRDFIHLKDLVAAHVNGLEYLVAVKARKILNLGYGKGFSVLETLRALEAVSGKKVPYEISIRRAGDPISVVANADLAKELLSLQWSHQDLHEICRDSFMWEERQLRVAA